MPRRGPTHHPWFARLYVRVAGGAEVKGAAAHRDEMLAGLSGRVLEVGCGHGLNFAHYPEGVELVVGVEPEETLRAMALSSARRARVPVRVVAGLAEALPVRDGGFDAAVASLVLCSVRSQQRALGELRRALRAGGDLRFYEHVRSGSGAVAACQRAVDLVWPLCTGGCHTSRDTVSAIERAGFRLQHHRRFAFQVTPLVWATKPHVVGRAVRD